jgi:hypothetical protein
MQRHSYYKKAFTLPCISVLLLILICGLQAVAQIDGALPDDKIASPGEEEFTTIDALATPWRDSGCILFAEASQQEPGCKNTGGRPEENASLTIYDSDGSVWYSFSVWEQNKDYFLKYSMIPNDNPGYGFHPEIYGFRKEGFHPLATPGVFLPYTVVLRMVGESPHWYKVEVDEQARDVRYIAKNDPMWAKKSWDFWLYKGFGNGENIIFGDRDREPLRDKPNGKVIEDSPIGEEKLKVLKVEGEWIYVKALKNSYSTLGWIRWRNGRDILLKCRFLFIRDKFVTGDPDHDFFTVATVSQKGNKTGFDL